MVFFIIIKFGKDVFDSARPWWQRFLDGDRPSGVWRDEESGPEVVVKLPRLYFVAEMSARRCLLRMNSKK